MDEASGHDGPLSDAEFDRFKDLLRRYCAHELDQWENLQIETPYGPIYVTMTRRLPPDWPAEAFRSF